MYVPEKLKLNKFCMVQLPDNRQIFARYGLFNNPAEQYSGDQSMPMHGNKADILNAADRENSFHLEFESRHQDDE